MVFKLRSHAWFGVEWGLKVSGMHGLEGGEERGILYQLAWGIQPVQTWLPWFPLFTLKSPETLFAKMTSQCYWDRGGRPLTPVSTCCGTPDARVGGGFEGGVALLACRYHHPTGGQWFGAFNGRFLDPNGRFTVIECIYGGFGGSWVSL